jgi:hypothetical protein
MAEKDLLGKVDRTALITQMNSANDQAAGRWDEVCRVYTDAWTTAYKGFTDTLAAIDTVKKKRVAAQAERIGMLFDLAAVLLPMIGGPLAIGFAPIVSARGQLLAQTVTRKAQAAWTGFASTRPIISEVIKEVGKHSVKYAEDAATKVKDGIIAELTPQPPKLELNKPENVADPVRAFTDNLKVMKDDMAGWVNKCAQWNVAGGWERELVPVAHDLFLKHPWITAAPPPSATQAKRAHLEGLIEVSLWLRWARQLDEPYWTKAHNWYIREYSTPARGVDQQDMVRYKSDMVVDWLEFAPIYNRLEIAVPRVAHDIGGLSLYDPRTGHNKWGSAYRAFKTTTIDMLHLIVLAKNANDCVGLLRRVNQGAVLDSLLLHALAKM